MFGSGQYAPGSTVGQNLLAHELTHVIQQDSASANVVRRQEGQVQSKCYDDQGHECPPDSGPPAREIDEDNPSSGIPPLIYSYLEARRLGVKEKKRSKRKSVGYAQQLLNAFLCRYDNWKAGKSDETLACSGENIGRIEAIRRSLPPRLKVDCWFGDKTDRATRMFQLCTGGLEVDGKIGKDTWPWLRILENGGANPISPKPPKPKQVFDACYDYSEITVVDKKTKKSQTCSAITDPRKPTPTGVHCIRKQGDTQLPGKDKWYLLEPQFQTTRCRMSLHYGTRTEGCITVTDKDCFDKLEAILNLEREEVSGVGHDGRPPGHTCCTGAEYGRPCRSEFPRRVKCIAVLYVGSSTDACDFI